MLKIVALQFEPKFGQISANLDKIEDLCRNLEADLVVLPELCLTGYQFKDPAEVAGLAEPADGPSMARINQIARKLGGFVVVGFAEEERGSCYNSAALVSEHGIRGLYRKVHLFDREKELFTHGNLRFSAFEAGGVRVGLMICFDWIFPEAARSLTLDGAHIIAHPANLVLPWCQTSMPVRALENRVFTVTANRTGTESRLPGSPLNFTGNSRICAPDGTVLAEGSRKGEEIIEVIIDPDLAQDKHVTPNNDLLADRNPNLYR